MRKPSKKATKVENQNPEAATEEPKGSHSGKKILSIAIDPALHSRLALLARCEGKSVTELVVESVSKNLKARIAAALESLKADLEK
jgi:predicted HicB family RNase H-like nuclease